MQNIKFTEKFYLTVMDLAKKTDTTVSKPKQQPSNIIFIVDVSGSMSYELDLIRKQLKNKLPSLVKEGDTITIIWFSGRNDSGVLMEEVEIKTLTNLQTVNAAIDRFLKPIGATAFHKPLVLAKESIQRIKKNRPNTLFSLIFLTDGYNNDCSWSDVTKSLKEIENDLSASTFVEYGYYADSRRIAEMAELVGGEKVEAQRFDDYEVVFENKVQRTNSSAKKVLVDAPANTIFDFGFTISNDGEIILYSVSNNQVMIPENTESILFFSDKANSKDIVNYNEADKNLNKLIYTSLYVLTDKLKNDYVDHVFKVLGDTNLYSVFSNAYGKEKLMNFKAMVRECVTDESKRFYLGRSTNLVADENAYCVMNLIDDLTKDENALLYTGHDDFSYKRIGAKKVNKAGILTEEEKKQIASASTLEEAKRITESIAATKEPELHFEASDKNAGSPISNLVWSSERANLSIGVRYNGSVKLPDNNFGLSEIKTFIFRNYTIIKDGILNINRLPVSLSETTFNTLKANKLVDGTYEAGKIYTISFGHLPTVNKSMVKNISAKKLGEKEYELLKLKALEKAYKYYEELHFHVNQKAS
ncbi:MAG: VWA domain-containing protein [Richelia sp. RM2_1_2]|nr:VWA domain-containing protein [Richelia sp. RM2_1_2]